MPAVEANFRTWRIFGLETMKDFNQIGESEVRSNYHVGKPSCDNVAYAGATVDFNLGMLWGGVVWAYGGVWWRLPIADYGLIERHCIVYTHI